MDLALLRQSWNRLAETDPMWAVLMEPERKGNRWNLQQFYRTGQSDVELALQLVREARFPLRRGKALDFGCGLGRLSQALACYFDEVHGVDIAPTMIRKARLCNPYGSRLRFHHNERDDLSCFGDNQFDFILSLIVLQHMRPDYSKKYVAEFMRILAPGGLLCFQQPSYYSSKPLELGRGPFLDRLRRRGWRDAHRMIDTVRRLPGLRGRCYDYPGIVRPTHKYLPPFENEEVGQFRVDRGNEQGVECVDERGGDREPPADQPANSRPAGGSEPTTELYTIPRSEMLAHLRSLGGRIVDAIRGGEAGPHHPSYRYLVTK